MVVKSLIQAALHPFGLELRRRPDPVLPMLHEFRIGEETQRIWLSNPFTKSWWYEPRIALEGEFAELVRLCAPGDTIIEVGAHHGMMTTLLSRRAGEHGRIFAIEASADNALVLDANCFQNRLGNVTTSFLAFGKSPGTVKFGGESLAAASGTVREVEMVTADHFCHEQKIDHVDLLKIDVEGFEAEVLEGAGEILKQRPKLALELHVDLLRDSGSSAQAVWGILDSAGMLRDRTVMMLCRPEWNEVREISDFSDIPNGGVVNLFVG